MSECQLVCVDPVQIKDFWPHVQAMLGRACERTLHDYNGMKRSLDSGQALLWLAWDGEVIQAAATTELHKINGKLRCFISALGGQEHERWLHLLAGLEQHARNEHCASVVIMGRKAWRRLAKEYRERGVILERKL